tara:strand:+ start:687 stop:1052 length:366 start_codon:yes stop_codon:yes gene_type:complete
MSILSFTNQGMFTGETDIDGFNVDTFPQNLTADQQKSALAFNGNVALETTTLLPASGRYDGGIYTMDIDAGYHGKVFAIIFKDRLSTQFTYTSAAVGQTFGAVTYDSVGPEIRRLVSLGYV